MKKKIFKVYFNLEKLKIWRTSPNLNHFGGKKPSWLGGAEIDSVLRPKLVLGPALSQLHLILEFFYRQNELNWVRFFKFELFWIEIDFSNMYQF